jgi:hypothetical protein
VQDAPPDHFVATLIETDLPLIEPGFPLIEPVEMT